MDDASVSDKVRIAIVGGGAAGYFSAIACAEKNPKLEVHLIEGTNRPLNKVRISGGGRCNVTHACFEPAPLTKNYPRGFRELLGPFHSFQPKDTVKWFAARGVVLKTEDDGRMFPESNKSETIAQCLEGSARSAGVHLRLGEIVKSIRLDQHQKFILETRQRIETFDVVLLATGSAPIGHKIAHSLGHTLVESVPSLFTFEVQDQRLEGLSGLSFSDVEIKLIAPDTKQDFVQRGPMLITHWGLSGPAVLKLSAWAARFLYKMEYKATLRIAILPNTNREILIAKLTEFKNTHSKKMLKNEVPLQLPKRYWHKLLDIHLENPDLLWADVSKKKLTSLVEELVCAEFKISGKGTFKEEFVTAGGVPLAEVDFRSMQSKIVKNLFFAGEILDVDGVTGGFNFQNAWTTGWIAGQSIGTLQA